MGKGNGRDPELPGEDLLKKSWHQFIFHRVGPERQQRTGPTGKIHVEAHIDVPFSRALHDL